MKQILGIDNKKILNAQRFVVHGNELADRHDIANAFNDYFTSIGSTLMTSSISSNTNSLSYINVVGHTLYMPNVSNNDVISIVHSLKTVLLAGMVFRLLLPNNVSIDLSHL